MRILSDVDGVVADFVGLMLTTLQQVGGPHLTEEDVVTYDLKQLPVPALHVAALHDVLREPGWCGSIAPYPDARAALTRYAQQHELVFVTAPFKSRTWEWERRRWLEAVFARSSEIPVIMTDHKHIVSGDVFIEDNHHHLNRWMAEHPNGLGILIDRPVNRGCNTLGHRVHDWDEVDALITSHCS